MSKTSILGSKKIETFDEYLPSLKIQSSLSASKTELHKKQPSFNIKIRHSSDIGEDKYKLYSERKRRFPSLNLGSTHKSK
jgi:hypothetical protein